MRMDATLETRGRVTTMLNDTFFDVYCIYLLTLPARTEEKPRESYL